MTSLQKSLALIVMMLFVFYILTHIEFHRTSKNSLSDRHEHENLKKNKQLDQDLDPVVKPPNVLSKVCSKSARYFFWAEIMSPA